MGGGNTASRGGILQQHRCDNPKSGRTNSLVVLSKQNESISCPCIMLWLALYFSVQFLRTLSFLWRACQNCYGPCVRPSAHLYASCSSITAELIFMKFVTQGVLIVALPRYADATLRTANHQLKVSLRSYRNCSDRFPPLNRARLAFLSTESQIAAQSFYLYRTSVKSLQHTRCYRTPANIRTISVLILRRDLRASCAQLIFFPRKTCLRASNKGQSSVLSVSNLCIEQ